MKLIHIAGTKLHRRVWKEEFRRRIEELGELTLIEDGLAIPAPERAAVIRDHDVAITNWSAAPIPEELSRDPGRLSYVCHASGSVRSEIPLSIVQSPIPVTNWGDAPAGNLAQGAMALLLATSLRMHERIMAIRDGEWGIGDQGYSLAGMEIGIYGFGVIARRFLEMLRPFGADVAVFDPYAEELPGDVERVDTLESLFRRSRTVVVHAGLNDETRLSVTAELLALLPDHGIIINTARGGIIDQAALFRELENGRLWAGLDVLEPDHLPPDHPARRWPNLILSAHQLGKAKAVDAFDLERFHYVCLDNLGRFARGEPLRFLMDENRYNRST